MRAALTILGVAIGVTVVMVIGALISGFNKGISDMLGSLGPKTFWVGRYWGGQDEDPEDPDPWRRRPPVTIAEARRLEERSEEHTSELQSRSDLVCRLLLEKKKMTQNTQVD